ncbi:hypothetical protein DFH06DRAFT_544080 [Mycena polygramma]|nr:hypothetical protein DFH06DRAFT_544080 [Mycena polygramma]
MASCVGRGWTLAPTEETLEAMRKLQHHNCTVPVSERKSALTEFDAAEYEYILVPLCADVEFFILEAGQAPRRFSAPYTGFPRVTSSVNPVFVTFYSRQRITRFHIPDSERWHLLFNALKLPWLASFLPKEFFLCRYPATLVTLTGHGSEPELHHGGPESEPGSDETAATPADEGPSFALVPDKVEFVRDWLLHDASQPHERLVLTSPVWSRLEPAPPTHHRKPARFGPLHPRWQTESERGKAFCKRLAKRQRTESTHSSGHSQEGDRSGRCV